LERRKITVMGRRGQTWKQSKAPIDAPAPVSILQPFIQMAADEIVVIEVRISLIDAVDFLLLSGSQGLSRIETPDSLQQSLAAEHVVDACNTAGKAIDGVEKGGRRSNTMSSSLPV